MNRAKTQFLAIFLTFTILLAGCSLPGSDDNLIRYNISVNVDNLDPQYVTTPNETLLVLNCFEGLVKLDEAGKPILALAQRYSLSEDRRTYTFYLREDLLWSDGEPLTAKDFAFAFQRIFNPASPSPSMENFNVIENGSEVASGQLPASRLGVRAIDGQTLEIRLKEPDVFFLERLTLPAAMPCREDFFLSCNGRYGLSLNSILFNGPYVMERWKSGRYISLRANKTYYNPLSLPTVAVNLYTTRPAEENVELLLEDRSDGGPVFYGDLAALEGYPIESYQSTVHLLTFNPSIPAFQDNDIRMGMCYAVNRQLFQPTIEKNLEITNLLIPPTASILGQPYRSLAPHITGMVYQREKAKELFEKGLNRMELSKLPRSNMICLETGQHRYLAGYLQQQWQRDLNLYVNLEVLNETDFYSRLNSGDYEMAILPLSLEQPEPGALIKQIASLLPASVPLEEPVNSESSSPEDGEPLEQAPQPYSTAAEDKQALDTFLNLAGSAGASEAAQWYSQAERLLLEKGYVAPLYFEEHYFAISPDVSGIWFTPYPGRVSFQNGKKK